MLTPGPRAAAVTGEEAEGVGGFTFLRALGKPVMQGLCGESPRVEYRLSP
jgi:hypothetical protein